MEVNKIYCCDCLDFMSKMENNFVDLILTSPPYNTSRNSGNIHNHEKRYDIYLEKRENEEYIKWIINIFKEYDRVLKDNRVVLFNISYGNEKPSLLWLLLAEIIKETNFMIADNIIWKKQSALPNSVSHNKLTRICEYVFVFCRKNEYNSFLANKQVTSKRPTGQLMYENIFNIVYAKNNDECNGLNKATYSTDLCNQLLAIYGKKGDLVFDSFMGTGTTALSSYENGMNYIGCELSQEQCNYANKRLENAKEQLKLF